MNNENIKVEGCSGCPFYSYHTEDGSNECWHLGDIDSTKRNPVEYVTLTHKNMTSSIPKKCPLLTKSFTINFSEDLLK